MLTSKNPKGQIEVYTDIGQFIGILPPDYPGLGLTKQTGDGVPGAGNLTVRVTADQDPENIRRAMDEIAETWAKLKKAGASEKVLQAFYDSSGFAELSEKARRNQNADGRR